MAWIDGVRRRLRLPAAADPSRVPVLLGTFVALSLLTRWLSLVVEILDTDEAAHVVGSWVLLEGGRLYRDFVDNKPPLLYAYYALAQLPLGRGLVPVRLTTVLVTVPLTALAASAVYRHDRRGAVAGLLHLVYGAAFLAHDMLAVNAELVLLLPAAWAVALLAPRERAERAWPLAWAGVLLGLATLVKHQAAFWLPALAWVAVRAGEGARPSPRVARLVPLGVGFMAPLVATGAGFAAAGAGPELVDWLLWRNVAYASNPISPAEALGRGASALLPWLLATAPLWWAWWRSRPRLDPHRRRLVDGLVAFGLLPAFAGLRFFPHYFVPVGFALSLGAAPAVASWLTSPRTSRGRLFLAATALLVAGFQAANAFLYLGERRIYRETDPVYRRTAERLAADACFESSRLFVWGWSPAFYYEAGLRGARPASRFVVLVQAGLTGYVPGNLGSVRRRSPDEPEAAGADWDHLLDDLERSRATYIVDTAPAGIYRWDRYPIADYPRFEAYVREHYEPFASVDRVRLYRRRGCAVR